LTNIARDVGEDARAGRLYLPLVWLREAGIDPGSWLRQPRFDAALAGVVRRLLHTADTLYAAADEGVAGLPKACRPGINAARFLYAEIGQIVRQSGCDSVSRRAVVPMRRKLVLLLGAFCHRIAPFPAARSTALAETHFLLAEVTVGLQSMPPSEPLPAALAWWRFHSRLVWLIDLFARLEHSERHQQLDRI
jgi:phytoene synthase